jgi:predicted RNA binding protein YcfA (HicA-like mRNA interferase family)
MVSRKDKILEKILRGTSDANIPFRELCDLLVDLGFSERVHGSHHIFVRPSVQEILNLQPSGNKAKAYRVKQVRQVILRYKLGGIDDEV